MHFKLTPLSLKQESWESMYLEWFVYQFKLQRAVLDEWNPTF